MITQKEFLGLLEPMKPALFGFAFRMLGNGEDAKDALQELIYRMWKKRKKLNEQKNIKSYVFTAMHHLCIDELRRRKKSFNIDEVVDEIPAFAGMTTYVADLVEHIRQEVKRLPYKQRVIIELHDFQEFTYDEIAKMMEMEVNAVRVNLSRARARVAEKFKKEMEYASR